MATHEGLVRPHKPTAFDLGVSEVVDGTTRPRFVVLHDGPSLEEGGAVYSGVERSTLATFSVVVLCAPTEERDAKKRKREARCRETKRI